MEKCQNDKLLFRAKSISNNKGHISTINRAVANQVLLNPEWDKRGLEVFIPNYLMVKQGVIKGVSTEISITDIKNNLEVHSYWNKLEVLDDRRLTKRIRNSKTGKTEEIDFPTKQFTVLGQELPATAYIYNVEKKVEKYYPQIRQCYRCFHFGHLKVNCKAPNERCMRCGEVSQENHQCENDPRLPICFHCKQNHKAIDKSCPRRKHEQEIKNMATDEGVSVAEMKKLIKTTNRSYTPNPLEFPPLGQSQRMDNNESMNQCHRVHPSSDANKAGSAQRPHESSPNVPHQMTPSSRLPNPANRVQRQTARDFFNYGTSFFSKRERNNRDEVAQAQKPSEMRKLHKEALLAPGGRSTFNDSSLNIYSFIMSNNGIPQEGEIADNISLIKSTILNKTSLEKLLQAVMYMYNQELTQSQPHSGKRTSALTKTPSMGDLACGYQN
ncbi:hypothetical protein QAD02_016338 [Eretmocerus hayati]|uniref:Uncharacterized protein n=1 Tax=Eretmocerus hayati TaxID=131215 RepID=A0ACC2PC21_9HYME|nr:hypothetical protein QAD02_016338 [Eretmocerus hayati]